MNEIKVGEAGGRVQTILVDGRITVAEALRRAGVELNGRSVRVNGSTRSVEDFVSDGDTVVVQNKKYSGGF